MVQFDQSGGDKPPSPPSSLRDAPVVELRRYVLRLGGFQALVNLFEQHLIAGQREAGILLGGIFAEEGRPDRFVWWRGFAGMQERRRALEAFYQGPIWASFAGRANATMVDSEDVLMLRPTRPQHREPPPRHPTTAGGDAVATMIVRHSGDTDVERWLTTELHARLEGTFGYRVATWRTEPAHNTFPRLPVRTEPAFVASATFSSATDRDTVLTRHAPALQQLLTEQLGRRLHELELMRLQPTAPSSHPRPEAARDRPQSMS
jgi:hypothetical protein